MAKKNRVIRYLIPVLAVLILAAVTCSYYSGYPFEKWLGSSLS